MRSFVRYFNFAVAITVVVIVSLLALGLLRWPEQDAGSQIPFTMGEVTAGPVPAFVQAVSVPEEEFVLDAVGGVQYRLLDQQMDLTQGVMVSYTRLVVDIEDRTGAESFSNQLVEFFPDFQSIYLHEARVIRDGVSEDRLPDVFFDRIQAETQLDQRVITGREQGLMRVPNVRAGDRVDISWSVKGSQPAFENHVNALLMMQYPSPVEKASARVITPVDTTLSVLGGAPAPDRQVVGDTAVYTLEAERVIKPPPMPVFPKLHNFQSWFITSFEDWRQVGAWGRRLYPIDRPSQEVRDLAERLRASSEDRDTQIVNAIQFVQDHIQYFAVSLGDQGYVPVPAETTLRTRSGDCKAKSLLLAQVLRLLGAEAQIVFVNSLDGRTIPDLPASPMVFDHVIVKMTRDGETYWIDPTIAFQRGDLQARSQPDYGWGLVLGAEGSELQRMPTVQYGDAPFIDQQESFYLGRFPGDRLVIASQFTYRGPAADAVRALLEGMSEAEKLSQFSQSYQQTFPDLQTDHSSFFDNTRTNVIRIAFELTAEGFFPEPDSEGARVRWLSTDGMQNLTFLLGSDRDFEVPLSYPFHAEHQVLVQLPGPETRWDIADEAWSYEGDAFDSSFTATYAQGDLTLNWRQAVHTNWVMPDDAMRDAASEAADWSRYRLYTHNPAY